MNHEYGKTNVPVTHVPHAASFASKVFHLDKGLLQAQAETQAASSGA